MRTGTFLCSILVMCMCAICREVRLVAELLYSGLTTGAGLQTLGEEYCDILQAAGVTATLLRIYCAELSGRV